MIHSDGGDIYRNTEYSIWSWASVLCDEINTFDTRFLIACVDEEQKVKDVTDAELVRYVLWNIEVMQSGVHPTHDHRGKPLVGQRLLRANTALAGGWRASAVGTQSDLQEEVELHKYTRNYMAKFLCERCLGNRHTQTGSAYDFSPNAMWRSMLISHQTYLAGTVEISPWANLRSWTIHRHRDDMLHMVWLGFGKDVAGQLLFEIATQYGLADKLDDNLAALRREMIIWFKARGVPCGVRRFRKSTVSVSDNLDFPTLESKMKAANSKLVFIWTTWKAVDIVNSGKDESEHAKLRASTAWSISESYSIMLGFS